MAISSTGMKHFEANAFNFEECRQEADALERLLKRNKVLKEQKQILPFFRRRMQLSAICGAYNTYIGRFDRIAWEYELFGDYRCDLVVGDSVSRAYCFVELEDAGPKSIFEGKKSDPDYSRRFEHGFSQIVDWFCRLDDMIRTNECNARFGGSLLHYEGLLVIGRDRFIDLAGRQRLDWRKRNLVLNSKHIHCVTYDELFRDISDKLNSIRLAAGIT